MGIFDGLMGNASELKIEDVQQEMKEILTSGEAVKHAYKVIRDTFIFTNKRLIPVSYTHLTLPTKA